MPKFNSFVYDIVATFKPAVIHSLCCVKFRLSPRYKNKVPPFGFDWIRTGDATSYVGHDIPYEGHMGTYYPDESSTKKRIHSSPADHLKVEPEMYERLCQSYPPANLVLFPAESGARKPYHVPVLSLYPPCPNRKDVTAYLILELDIKKRIRRIVVNYDQTLLNIGIVDALPTEKGHHERKIAISCLKEFSTDQYVKIYAVSPLGKKSLAGMIRVAKNAKEIRREINVLLVNVKMLPSSPDSEPLAGNAQAGETAIKTVLSHTLTTANIETTDLDLGYNPDLSKRIVKHNGNRVIIAQKLRRQADGQIVIDPNVPNLAILLTEHLKKNKDLDKYDAIIYAMGIEMVREANQSLSPLAASTYKKYVLLKKDFTPTTAIHETLHTLGIMHTFDNCITAGLDCPFTYRAYLTDNIMDYSHVKGVERVSLWEWQWKLVRLKGKPEQQQLNKDKE